MASVQAPEQAHAQVWARLDGIGGINAYDGEVPTTPPKDPDGRVHAYVVLWMGAGAWRGTTLGDKPGQLCGTGQVTCVGGDVQRALWCVGKVREGLPGLVTIDGRQYRIRLRQDDPGPVRVDLDVTPNRFYLPLEFSIFIP